ncbi:MAG TPA: iron-sulfur cluster assembly accessory protein [Verrucomicrobiae bacterium]|nr:iron-sulfur cluster assembly accessory protein [Verrucomicrobiae bacterium]
MEDTILDGVTLTTEAATQILLLMSEQRERGLRIFVEDGGCSGKQYGMSIDSPKDDDRIFELEGAKVFIDPVSLEFLRGSVVDYEGGLTGAGFRVRNPNAKRSCGCGTSFEK